VEPDTEEEDTEEEDVVVVEEEEVAAESEAGDGRGQAVQTGPQTGRELLGSSSGASSSAQPSLLCSSSSAGVSGATCGPAPNNSAADVGSSSTWTTSPSPPTPLPSNKRQRVEFGRVKLDLTRVNPTYNLYV